MSSIANNDVSEFDLLENRSFEERADHITDETILNGTATFDYFDNIQNALLSKGLILLEGPRGSGKTHIMRHTWLRCRDDTNLPLAVYVSFNRYLRLEPLLRNRSDALNLFQAWTLSRILLACDELANKLPSKATITRQEAFNAPSELGLESIQLQNLVSRLERGIPLNTDDEEIVSSLSIESVADTLINMAKYYKRKRIIVLLDDAALTLTPEYMVEFFDIVRVLKRSHVSPKASVYPGTTEYGSRFHVDHEGKTVSSWLSVEHDHYHEIMEDIGRRRFPAGGDVPIDVRNLLMYAAFGVPRSYLAMLREWIDSPLKNGQQTVNHILQNHNKARIVEFNSLGLKLPQFSKLIESGNTLFTKLIDELRVANTRNLDNDSHTKQLIVGIEGGDHLNRLEGRMINLLIEAGLLYELPSVSHGEERSYRRVIPHLAALIAARVFSEKSKGSSNKQVLDYLARTNTKHPVRRKLSTLLTEEQRALIKLDLPPCPKCKVQRLTDSQKFCGHCGTKLIDDSTFTLCMSLTFDVVPNITDWAKTKLAENNMHKLGDVIALQDPGTELRKIYMVGAQRAQRIVSAVEKYVDEFLS